MQNELRDFLRILRNSRKPAINTYEPAGLAGLSYSTF